MTIVLDKVVEDLASKVVNKFVQTIAANMELVSGIGSAIAELTSDIETFNARLVDASKNQDASELQVLRVAVKKFRSVVDEAQDAVAKYIALNKKHEDTYFAKYLDKIPYPFWGNITVQAKEIQSISIKMNKLLQTHEKDLISYMTYTSIMGHDPNMQPLQPNVEGGNPTGFEYEEERLNTRLMVSSSNHIVIPIVGLPGTGKTAFAYQIFSSTNKLNTFAHNIWVHVSQSFVRNERYIDILCEITKHPRDEYFGMHDVDLVKRIREHLKDKKYFIVLDDIWEKNDWESLAAALPINSQGSRVLATTRFRNVVDTDEEPHILKQLDPEVSWKILEKIVFGKEGFLESDSALLSPGKDIAKRCKGLPLSLVMVGGVLRKNRALAYWKRVAGNPFQEINKNDKSYHKVLRLSYDHLPHGKLRNCFLYFASFPMGQEIAASKLVRLWIAEEFIPTVDEWGYSVDLELEAQNYLKDLVDRNLVIPMKISADGQIKTCRIHDSLHEFCKIEAAKNDLFHIIDGEQKLDAITVSSHRRRLCFHSSSSSTAKIFDVEDDVKDDTSCSFLNCYNKMKKKKKRSPYPSGEHVHSLLLSSSQNSDIDLKQEELIAIPNAFPLLRVLDIESFKLSFELPNELFSLDLLRYLAITIDINILPPKAFKNLPELQTLVIKTTTEGTVLEINGGIWNMEKLRHVQTKNASMQLPSPPQKTRRQSNTGKTNIRTLSSISPTSCQKEIFSKTPHLKKLGVRGNLAELLEEKEEICLFNNLQMLKCLENLKLYGKDENALKVPMLDKFAHRLRKLTFYKTFFEWDDMSILGSLEELEVLKLDENAFRGEKWDLKSNVVFNQLQYLRIGRTNLKIWTTMENSFPVLENLVLRKCTSLETIPIAFAKVHSLKVIELYHMSEKATNSARHVAERRRDDKENNVKELDLKITHLSPKERAMAVQEDIGVGFGHDLRIIKDRLTGGSSDLTFISVVGAAGHGKTTMAKMVFNDLEIHYEFFTRIWVYVSRTFSRREVFLEIIRHFTREIEGYRNTPDELLAKNIKKLLEGGKYFIVMDDVWTVEDWDCLKIAFPKNMKGSRVLVTTRYMDLALHADSANNPHHLEPLNPDESWELLEKKVFHGERCPPLLEPHGRKIAERCQGLPLAVLTIAGILRKDNSLAKWKRFAEDPLAVFNLENRSYHELVRLSYNQLPSHLKNCFLYLAVFPRGYEIGARKLIRLWIAEGFISPVKGESTSSNLELTAEKYLSDLVDRNLLMVVKRKADGQIKTCRLHDSLHNFCTSEAAKANLFHEMDDEGAGLEVNVNPHRLCIHSSISDFLRSKIKPPSKDVCSFLSFCPQRIEIPREHSGTIAKAFPLLRVVDVESLTFEIMSKEFYSLYQLRYLAISAHLGIIPALLNKLGELETLVLNTSQSSIEVGANLWSMPKLRHVHTSSPMLLPPPPENSKKIYNSKIQTLSTISTSSCTRETFDNTPNLQKLGICGDFVEHMEMMMSNGGTNLFDNLHKLECLENLKLINEAAAIQHSQLLSFPSVDKFPPRLRRMTLCNTRFDWKDMSILGSLDELEVLKLDDFAFLGEVCDVSNIVFKRLQYLRINRTDLVSWIASKDSFPVLEYLILRHCESLDAIPSSFGEVESLKVMDLFCTNTKAANSAREIHNPNMSGTFQLSIYPPYH